MSNLGSLYTYAKTRTDRYQTYLASLPADLRPTLVMLATRPIQSDTDAGHKRRAQARRRGST